MLLQSIYAVLFYIQWTIVGVLSVPNLVSVEIVVIVPVVYYAMVFVLAPVPPPCCCALSASWFVR